MARAKRGQKGGTVAAHYYEAELPNFAGRYVVSTSRSPPGLERGVEPSRWRVLLAPRFALNHPI